MRTYQKVLFKSTTIKRLPKLAQKCHNLQSASIRIIQEQLSEKSSKIVTPSVGQPTAQHQPVVDEKPLDSGREVTNPHIRHPRMHAKNISFYRLSHYQEKLKLIYIKRFFRKKRKRNGNTKETATQKVMMISRNIVCF